MPAIVLATMNARYSHASFGLRYLMANLGPHARDAVMLEFEIKNAPVEVAEAIIRQQPAIVGLGVYIWNVAPLTEVARLLKERLPGTVIVVGGPEVSHEFETQPVCDIADYVITGEADLTFPELCGKIIRGQRPASKFIFSGPPDTTRIALPYHLYSDEDVAHRVIYVEASRGCPFTCEFCLSSLDQHLNRFSLEQLLPAFQTLLDRGVKEFKFVDRTFNLSVPFSLRILEFFLERYRPGIFLHFEMIPDRLPDPLKEILRCFPRGALQFEVGIQTFNARVAALISRKQNYERTEQNIRWLLEETGAHIHADLIVGLPGEDLASTGTGFDRLLALKPQEIQVNPLKRLRGTPIIRHTAAFALNFDPAPPYEIISTSTIDAGTMTALRRFARFWNLYGNSGNFIESLPLLWATRGSPFAGLWEFFAWLYERHHTTHNLSLDVLVESLWKYFIEVKNQPPEHVALPLARDYIRGAARDLPKFLRPYAPELALRNRTSTPRSARLQRQQRHAGISAPA